MPRKIGWFLAIAIAGAIAAYYFSSTEQDKDSNHAEQIKSSTFVDDINPGIGSDQSASPTSSTVKQSHPFESGYRWNPNNPGIAENQQDAAWLDAHGYPDPDVEAHLMSLSLDALKNLADRGNKPAQAFYALRLAQSGADQRDTQETLIKSAASGSVFALKMAGDIYYTVDGYRDPVMASVFYGLQARQGDHAGITQNYLVDSALTPDQRLRAQALRELTWINMRNIPNQGAKDNLSPSPRPGLVAFLEQALLPEKKQ